MRPLKRFLFSFVEILACLCLSALVLFVGLALRFSPYFEGMRFSVYDIISSISILYLAAIVLCASFAICAAAICFIARFWSEGGGLSVLYYPCYLALVATGCILCLQMLPLQKVVDEQYLKIFMLFILGAAACAYWICNRRVVGWMISKRRFFSAIAVISCCVALWFSVPLVANAFKGSRADATLIEKGSLPNIVLIVCDAMTSRDMSVYGYKLRTTPMLEEMTKTWTVFTRARSAGIHTTSLYPIAFMGRYPYLEKHYLYGEYSKIAGNGWLDMPMLLRNMGYTVAILHDSGLSPAFYHCQASWNEIVVGGLHDATLTQKVRSMMHRMPGPPSMILRPYRELFVGAMSFKSKTLSKRGVLNEAAYENAKLLLRQYRESNKKPFFLVLYALRPHSPYIANELMGAFLPLDAGFTDADSQNAVIKSPFAPNEQPIFDKLRLRYDENILKADQQIGVLISKMKELSLYDDAMIVITADHGSRFTNGYCEYNTTIPLLVKYPGQKGGKSENSIVSNVDIVPTILDVLGQYERVEQTDGISLLSRDNNDDRVIYEQTREDKWAVVSGKYKIARRYNGALEMYDIIGDPDETVNVLAHSDKTSEGMSGEGLGRRAQEEFLKEALGKYEERRKFIVSGKAISIAPPLIKRKGVGVMQ